MNFIYFNCNNFNKFEPVIEELLATENNVKNNNDAKTSINESRVNRFSKFFYENVLFRFFFSKYIPNDV